ncbi:MAG: hypothetical protein KC423_01790 [Anaerolineales bacterium]|nr:hypothetical protein [Anaerolineales bacterium]MCB9432673.1 hypothetical protein [Ardenticatenaceae bacterium]
MTLALEKAFNRVANLPEVEQDAFAAWIMAELEAEARWDRLFEDSQDLLATLANQALLEYDEGKTEPLDPDAL